MAVGREVPGFGGLFVDPAEPDRVKVWLVNPAADFEPATVSLVRLIGNYPGFAASRIDAMQGQYGFVQLQGWHDQLFARIASVAGVTSTDVQERTNRLEIGVRDVTAREEVLKAAAALEIPSDALTFIFREPYSTLGSLENYHRPLVASLKVVIPESPYAYCTLGFIATRNGIPGAVINSHCTGQYLSPGSSSVYQWDPLHEVGFEAIDPTPFPASSGGVCNSDPPYSMQRCRFSDAAWIHAEVQVSQGLIAKASYDSPDWDESSYLFITAVLGPYVGEPVSKVGAKTGRSDGHITGTNVNTPVDANGTWLLWQHTVDYRSLPGDSGSTVFHDIDGLDVSLRGISWGANAEFSAVFSDAQYMQFNQDLGTMDVKMPPSGGGGR